MLRTILLVVLIVIMFGALPYWPYMATRGFGYGPSSVALLLLAIVLVLISLRRI
ncbi:DUF3309 domain-containing protein [Rhizobium sp. P32RR-XVIII]|uniref:DUF3309 family protein n=1 Tax=Rhizobium sp. P32RR-XVIII TaxID=2726738 RepID=UPI001456FB53|nr:DUF3309 family protein [Rhizobium sp. P32RR-XVIII]NLS02676.1 DUF3309 domain-containing protein [Rhizobium sp. P32RR-XVIII]